MIITKIEISGFGKLKDFTMEFKEGMQVVYGGNEYGKSTIMEFIKIMFYSRRCGCKAGVDDKALRMKYCPWGSNVMGGTIEFIHKGLKYRLQKQISPATPSRDKILFQNRSSGEQIILGKNEEVGKYIFGLDLKGFERSGYIGRVGKAELGDTKTEDSLSSRIIQNLFDTGDESISKGVISSRIEEACGELQKSRSGKIKDVEDQINDLIKESEEIQSYELKQQEYKQELSKAEDLSKEKRFIENCIRIYEKSKELNTINGVIKLIEERDRYIQNLEKSGLQLDQIEDLINRCKAKVNQIDGYGVSIGELRSMLKGDAGIYISQEEYNNFKLWTEESHKYSDVCEELKNNLIPRVEKLSEQTSLCAELKEAVSKMEEEIKKLSGIRYRILNLRNELAEKQKLRDETVREYESEKFRLDSGKSNLKFRRDNFESLIQKGKRMILFSGLFSILSIIMGIVWGQPVIASILPTIFIGLCIIFGFMRFRFNKIISDLEYKEAFSAQKISGDYKIPISDIEKEISDKGRQINALVSEESRYIALETEFSSRERQLSMNRDKLNMLKEDFDCYRDRLLKLYSFGDIKDNFSSAYVPEDLSDIIGYSRRIHEKRSSLKERVKSLLDKYGCKSQEEFEKRYILECNNKKTLERYNQLKMSVDKIKNEFILEVCRYKDVENYESAKLELKELEINLHETKQKIRDTDIRVNSTEFKNMTLESLKLKLSEGRLDNSDIVLSGDKIDEFYKRLDFLKSENLSYKIAYLNSKIKPLHRSLIEVQNELAKKRDKLENMKKYLEALRLAGEVINDSYDEIRNRFGPELDKRVSEVFSKFTGGKYDKLYVQKDYKIFVQMSGTDRESENLSNGTLDQAYLSLRIAVSELISRNGCRVPFLMDDSLMQYDDIRMGDAVSYLKGYADGRGEEFQIILFTCHRSVLDCAADNGIYVIR